MENPKLEWVTNEPKVVDESNVHFHAEESVAEALYFYEKWRSKFVEGDPAPTKVYSVTELKHMGIVGLYRES